ETPDQRGAEQRVTRHVLESSRWHVAWRQTCSAERVVAEHDVSSLRLDKDEDGVRLASRVLAGLRPQIAVEAVNTAGEAPAIVMRRERFDQQVRTGRPHVYEATRRSCSARARFSRSLGSGGLISASKN